MNDSTLSYLWKLAVVFFFIATIALEIIELALKHQSRFEGMIDVIALSAAAAAVIIMLLKEITKDFRQKTGPLFGPPAEPKPHKRGAQE